MSNFIRQLRAHEGEVVEIRWNLIDGGIFVQAVAIPPPKAVREARQWAEQQAQERRQQALGVEPRKEQPD